MKRAYSAIDSPTRVNGRVQLTSDHVAEVQAGLAKEREEKREQAKKAAIAEAERRAAMPYFDLASGEPSEDE